MGLTRSADAVAVKMRIVAFNHIPVTPHDLLIALPHAHAYHRSAHGVAVSLQDSFTRAVYSIL